MGTRRHSKRRESAILNNRTYIDIYNRMLNLAINCFEWINLPSSVDERYLELMLITYGYSIFFKDEVMGYLSLGGALGGQLNVYNIPTSRNAIAPNGYSNWLTDEDSVIIFDNYLRTPFMETIQIFARRLYECQRAIDTNIKVQKTPLIILCDEQQRLTMQNFYEQYDGNEPLIMGSKQLLDINDVNVLKTDAPFVADKLTSEFHNIWNDYLTICGIENSNMDKKERLVADEIEANHGSIEAYRNVRLNARRQACKLINEMFNLTGDDAIDVRFRSDLPTLVNYDNVPEGLNPDEYEINSVGGNIDEHVHYSTPLAHRTTDK